MFWFFPYFMEKRIIESCPSFTMLDYKVVCFIILTSQCELIQAKMCLWVMCRQRRPRSDCAEAQSDQGLLCLLTESRDTTEFMNGEKRQG